MSKLSLNYSPGSHGLATPQGTTSSRGQFSRLVALHFQNTLIKSTLVNITWLSLPDLALNVLLRWDRERECIPQVQASGFRNWLKYSLKKFLGNFFLRWHTLGATFTCYCADKWHQFNPTWVFLAWDLVEFFKNCHQSKPLACCWTFIRVIHGVIINPNQSL